jgi:hypothetical protein
VVARRALERASAHELLDRLSQSTVGFQLPSLEDDHDIQPTADTPTSAAPVSGVQDPLRLVCETLGVEEITPLTLRAALARYADSVQRDLRGELEAAGQLLEDQMERTAQLDDDNRNLRISADDDELEIAELMDQADRLRGEVRWLRAELAAKGEYETAYGVAGADVSDEYPSSCEELVLGLDGNVVFTGDLDEVRFVDERDTFGGCAREATRCVRTLEQYVKAKACGDTSKGVHHFLQHCPPGYDVVSSGKHALGESGYTMTHHGDERIFPVPAEVSPDGHSRMVAHFKLARIGQVTPRMYYLDDTAGTGCIYIGYLGRHLTNRMS